MTERKRRASRGFVSGPCPGCKEGNSHPVGDICVQCRAKLDRANELIAEHQAQTEDAWFSYPRFAHWAPGYHFGGVEWGGHKDQSRDRLHAAFHDLIMTAAKAVKHPEYYSGTDPELYRKHGPLIRRPAKWRTEHQSPSDHVLLPVKLAAAINAMDRATVGALMSVAEHSYANGTNLLRQMAVGDVTLDEFAKDTAERIAHLRKTREQAEREPVASHADRAER